MSQNTTRTHIKISTNLGDRTIRIGDIQVAQPIEGAKTRINVDVPPNRAMPVVYEVNEEYEVFNYRLRAAGALVD